MSIRKTIATIFMVPTLKIKREYLIENGFINGYLSDSRRDVQHRNAVYLLFKPTNLDKFREFLDNEYERSTNVIDDYDYEDGYVVVVYQLNPIWKEDFMLVREGMYSRTSQDFQKDFPKVIKIVKNGLHKDEISLQYRIFKKTDDLKQYWEDRLGINFTDDMEVWDGFDFAKETLNLDNVKQKQLI
jgi:hypothetical protein